MYRVGIAYEVDTSLSCNDKQINYDHGHDEYKTRTQRYSKLPGDGDLWAQNIITENLQG